MKFSYVDGIKVEAFKGGVGKCICCGNETIAKCGSKRINHWAHKTLIDCDPWWENETPWHREWKNRFPNDWQEVIHFDDKSGEKHIADVKTKNGIIIEFQNSPMSLEELESREKFYKNVVWILNGAKFKKRFHILGELPNPKLEYVKDISFFPMKRDDKGRGYYKYSENENNKSGFVLVHPIRKDKNPFMSDYIGHHLYDWIRPHSVWYDSKCRVFIDFGEEVLWELQVFDRKGLRCVRSYDKEYFIRRANK